MTWLGSGKSEKDFEIQEEEHRNEIQDLINALNSAGHNEQLLYNDLQEARQKIEKLTNEVNHTSIEDYPEESGASGGHDILENDGDEKAENTSLVWDNSHQSFLLGQQLENCHSIPKLSDHYATMT